MSSARSPLDIPELLCHVLSFVDGKSLSACLQVNHLWREEALRWHEKPRSKCLLTTKRFLAEAVADVKLMIERIGFIPDAAMVFVTGFECEEVRVCPWNFVGGYLNVFFKSEKLKVGDGEVESWRWRS